MKPMNPAWKMTWIEALRSSAYHQGRFELRTERVPWNRWEEPPILHCALGVLCDVYKPEGWQRTDRHWHHDALTSRPSPEILAAVGLCPEAVAWVTDMNDVGHSDFSQIADWIESHL